MAGVDVDLISTGWKMEVLVVSSIEEFLLLKHWGLMDLNALISNEISRFENPMTLASTVLVLISTHSVCIAVEAEIV
jgi:hypothetical protein